MDDRVTKPEADSTEDAKVEEPGTGRTLPASPDVAPPVSRSRLAMHLVAVIGLSTLAHVLIALRLDAGAAEAWRALAASEGPWHVAGAPFSTALIAIGQALSIPAVPAIRAPTILLWIALPLVVAAASRRLGGRSAAAKGAWLLVALPLVQVFGIFAGAGMPLALAFASASFILAGIARRLLPGGGGTASAREGTAPRAPEGALLGAAGALAVLAAPSGWLLPLSAAMAFLVMWPGLGARRWLIPMAPLFAIPLASFLLAGLLMGDFGWGLPLAPSEWSVHAAEVLPLQRLPQMFLVLLVGTGPLALFVMIRWGSWAWKPSQAPPRRLARGLLLLGGAPLGVLLLVSAISPVDPLVVAATLVPLVVGLSAWKELRSGFSRVLFTSGALTVLALFHLWGTISILPSDPDPARELLGWSEAGAGVEVWCGTVPDEGLVKVLARPELAARLVLVAPACEPIGLIGGPQEMARSRSALGDLVLLVHHAEETPDMPEGCAPGAFAAPAGPEELELVVRPSRCDDAVR